MKENKLSDTGFFRITQNSYINLNNPAKLLALILHLML
jgi:hypothetical protein